jgi:hypothetical protein
MKPEERLLQARTRRQLFHDCGVGAGKMALASLLGGSAFAKHHFAPRIDRVIYLFMAGGPSQLELFDYKPELQKWNRSRRRSRNSSRRIAPSNSTAARASGSPICFRTSRLWLTTSQ